MYPLGLRRHSWLSSAGALGQSSELVTDITHLPENLSILYSILANQWARLLLPYSTETGAVSASKSDFSSDTAVCVSSRPGRCRLDGVGG